MRLVREHVAIAAAILWLAACIEVTRAQQGPDVQPPSQGSNASQRPDSLPPMPPNAESKRKPEAETPTPFMLPSTSGSTERMAPTRDGTSAGQGTPQSPAELGVEMQAPKAADKESWGQETPPESVRTQTNDNPTGRQEPAVSLEWIGPPTAKLGQTITYQIMVKNVSSAPVGGVLVRNRLSAGVKVLNSQPDAQNDGTYLTWDIGTLEPRQEKRIDLQVQPMMKGDLACQATVRFTGSSTSHLLVKEPKLAIKALGPDKVVLNDPANLTLVVSNPGDGVAEQVKVRANLAEGLEYPRGHSVEFELGNLAPQESRSVQLVCNTKAGGKQSFDALATAEGNLRAEAMSSVEVVIPRIDITGTGPALRYLDRPATYVFKVNNPGSASAGNVTVIDQIPEGFKFVKASAGGQHDFNTRTVSWFVGEMSPGQSREVSLTLLAINPGEFKNQAFVEAARGLRNKTEVATRVEGLSALLMELVDLDDPVEIGVDTAYEIRVTNTGSKTETNLQLVCVVPDKMEFRGARSSANCTFHVQGKEVVFEPLPKLAPRADVLYRVNVRGIAPGDLRFRARIMADGLTDPVLKEESTKVYGDSALPK